MDFSSKSDYIDSVNEISFVGDIRQLFQFELVFTAAEIQAKYIYLAAIWKRLSVNSCLDTIIK